MSLLLNCQSLSKAFGSQKLFHELSLSIFAKDCIGLIGPNGAGKSTLMKILAGLDEPDRGAVSLKRGVRVGYVPQTSEFEDMAPKDVLLQSLEGELLSESEKLVRVDTWLTKLGFSGKEPSAGLLSGGWKKRLSIAKAMLIEPHILMLDEPTNHLDLEAIVWLEQFMAREVATFILVSHDRSFLKNVTNRTIEINTLYPEGLFSIKGTFSFFQEKKRQFMEGQVEQEKSIASKARRESEWLKQSPKARTTKARSRIEQAEAIFEKHGAVKERNRTKLVGLQFEGSERQTRKLMVGKNLKKVMGESVLFQNLDITLTAGMRLGLMGPNGSGKTTLMRLFAGELVPDEGTLKPAEDLKVVYFDQHRLKLSLEMTLKEALSPDGDFVHFQGQAIHVNGWCQRFLFSPDRLGMTLKYLSGGERARIAIAHLMLQPADILLLDEPTNDLDIPTLETLEANLQEFPGAVVLITHDRSMLDNLCTLFLALGDHPCGLYAEYAQWEAMRKRVEPKAETMPTKNPGGREERKERNRLEKMIEKRESELLQLENQLDEPDFEKLEEVCKRIEGVKQEIDGLFEKWADIEAKL